jgi:hypothetical protein
LNGENPGLGWGLSAQQRERHMAMLDPHSDPNVQEALKGRTPEEVSLICCRKCEYYSYYNDGPHFTCHWCGWSASGGLLDDMIETGEVISLADYADLEDGGPGIP